MKRPASLLAECVLPILLISLTASAQSEEVTPPHIIPVQIRVLLEQGGRLDYWLMDADGPTFANRELFVRILPGGLMAGPWQPTLLTVPTSLSG